MPFRLRLRLQLELELGLKVCWARRPCLLSPQNFRPRPVAYTHTQTHTRVRSLDLKRHST